MEDKIYEIIEKYDGSGEVDECVEVIEEFLSKCHDEVKTFKVWLDTDVFDSCGLDIFYIAVSWIDNYGYLKMCGATLTSY